jgi:M6 family metalloprotease-like protein
MNRINLPVLIIALLCQTVLFPVYAVKAYPFPITVIQPDGTSLTTLLHGDEFHHYQTTEDGYILKANTNGFLTYATFNTAGEVVESAFIAHNALKRTGIELKFLKSVKQATILQKMNSTPSRIKKVSTLSVPQKVFPLEGYPKSIVILVNFSDTVFVIPSPQMAFSNLLNQAGYSDNGGTGSARDYFMASSYGKFNPDFNVFGPVTLPHNMAFYGANDASGNDIKAVQMVVDACTAANNAGLDFTPYDTDNDGVVDNVFIYYAGHNEAEGGSANSIWPHSWSVNPQSIFPMTYNYTGTVASVTFNGKRVMDYACTSELRSKAGVMMCGVGTFCHEFGHVLGLPDYYDTATQSNPALGSWSIMDIGNYSNLGRTPPVYSVYDRFFLGWLTPEQESVTAILTLDPLSQSITPPANTTNQTFLLSATPHNLIGNNPAPNEFFMLEYRKQTGWDTYLPAEGMCIWHIDYNHTVWENNTPNNYTGTTQNAASHMHVYLQPLSGSLTTPGTAFTSGSFSPLTWTGTDINRSISDINKTATNITFNFMIPFITTTGSFTDFTTFLGTPSTLQSIQVNAKNLTGNLNLNLQDSINFDLRLSTDSLWSKRLRIVPTVGIINGIIQVRYNPILTGIQTDQLEISNPGVTTTNISLNGSATIGPNSPVIFVGKIDNAISYPATKLNVSNIKTINIQATDLVSDLYLAITGINPDMFAVSASLVTKDAANGTDGYSITITYLPTSAGNHRAILTVSGGGLNPAKVITLSGLGY